MCFLEGLSEPLPESARHLTARYGYADMLQLTWYLAEMLVAHINALAAIVSVSFLLCSCLLHLQCNQFGQQEPGSNNEIKNFAKKNYGRCGTVHQFVANPLLSGGLTCQPKSCLKVTAQRVIHCI